MPCPAQFGCIAQDELRNDTHPPELTRIVRACSEAQLYYSYSSYGLLDQQRVRDESAHVVLSELSQWMFTFLDRAPIEKLRDVAHPFFLDTCAVIEALGPPNYRAGYMIRYGMLTRTSDDDWQHELFDSDAAWRKAVSEINRCPTP